MSCSDIKVPEYLHFDNKHVYADADFLDKHSVYRLSKDDCAVEFPSTKTGYSVKWSELINVDDIFNVPTPNGLNSFRTASVSSIRNVSVEETVIDPEDGQRIHVITCSMLHSPNECDYSHSEILITHEIKNIDTKASIDKKTYTYKDWQSAAACPLSKKRYKNLIGNYQLEIIKRFQ